MFLNNLLLMLAHEKYKKKVLNQASNYSYTINK